MKHLELWQMQKKRETKKRNRANNSEQVSPTPIQALPSSFSTHSSSHLLLFAWCTDTIANGT